MDIVRSGTGNGLPAGVFAEAVRRRPPGTVPGGGRHGDGQRPVRGGVHHDAHRAGGGIGRYSSDLILRADQLQYELDEGPCLDAVWTDGVFVVPDLRATAGGRGGRPAAAVLGVGSSVSVHLFTDTALG